MEIVVLIAGLIFFAIGGLVVWDFRAFKQAAYPAQGQVVAYAVRRSNSKNGNAETYAPVVQYQVQGQSHQFTASLSSNQVKHRIGDAVPILIHRMDPARARLDTSLPAIIGGIFMALGMAAVIAFFYMFEVENKFSLIIAVAFVGLMLFKAVRALKRRDVHSTNDVKSSIAAVSEPADLVSSRDEVIISDPAAFDRHVTRKQPVWLMTVFLLAGMGMVAGGVYLGVKRADFIRDASVGYGKVVDFRSKTSSSDSGTSTTYYPIVEYTPQTRLSSVRFEHDIGSSHPGYRRGDDVKVLYSAANPGDAIIDEGWMNYFAPLLLFAMGSIFTMAGVSVIMKRRRQKAEEAQLKLDF